MVNEQLHALVVLQLLSDCRQVFLADELGTALALSSEAKLVVRAVLLWRCCYTATSWRAACGVLLGKAARP